MIIALLGFLLAMTLVIASATVLSVRIHMTEHHTRRQEQRLALQINPLHRAKVEEDRRYSLAQERQTAELELKREEFELKRYLALTRATPETYLLDYEPSRITALPSLRRVSEEKTNLHNQLSSVSIQPPTEDFLLSHIRQDSFTVSPGIRASTGEPVLIDITQVPHGKLIGASGFGKSTCMYIMLKQAAQTNSPNHLQLALLDLEHKTSRLLEDYPHVAALRVGKRLIQMVATNADMVAEYLGYLKRELDRRTGLSEQELTKQPILLIYVEEMLSLQYEVVHPKLLLIIFQSLTILSVRGRKYGMYLYACMQTDYSTNELKVSQKMFRFRGAAAIDVPAARAAGFQNTDLVKQNFQVGKPGQLVIEYPSFSDLVVVPSLELKRLLQQISGFGEPLLGHCQRFVEYETSPEIGAFQSPNNTPTNHQQTATMALQARLLEVQKSRQNGWGKVKIIEAVWNIKAGTSKAYKQAEQEYSAIVAQMEPATPD